MTDLSGPVAVSGMLMAFPADVEHLMPDPATVPAVYENAGVWAAWQNQWFCEGLKGWPAPKPGIDAMKAYRHLHCLQGTFSTRHEDKQATVAYLASLWLEPPAKE